MSKTSFDAITRGGIWRAYNCNCIYCSKSIDWVDLHIDHIIPESFQDNKKEFEKLIIDYNLDKNFNVNWLTNLVPCHNICNIRKRDILFSKPTTLYYFEITRTKIARVESEKAKLNTNKQRDTVLLNIEKALEKGIIKPNEIESLILEAKSQNWSLNSIKIPHGVEFIERVYDTFYSTGDYTALYDEKIKSYNDNNCIIFINNESDIIKAKTLNEYKRAVDLGYFHASNMDIKCSSQFIFLEEMLSAVKNSAMPKISFMSDPYINISNLELLSPAILHDPDGKLNEHIVKGLSIADLAKRKIVKISKPRGFYQICIEFDGMETSFIEQFRADFNNDGIEDVFIRGWTNAVDGTIGYGLTDYFTKVSDIGLITKMNK